MSTETIRTIRDRGSQDGHLHFNTPLRSSDPALHEKVSDTAPSPPPPPPHPLTIIGGSCHKYHFNTKTCATKHVPRQNLCLDKILFVTTKDMFCRDKHGFVAAKMILEAAPANDTSPPPPLPLFIHSRSSFPTRSVTVQCRGLSP